MRGEEDHVAKSITPFLMFQGSAEEAIKLYVSLFQGSTVNWAEKYGPGEQGAQNTFKRAEITLAGQTVICFDSPTTHAFGFTPSFSFFVECESGEELEQAFKGLCENGAVLMPLDNYGFSQRFGWVNDRFGVSWQLNLK
jgi:predicted 3-demethylubiquinone-9 3-methyltransferase (glyoxalase superfamily)